MSIEIRNISKRFGNFVALDNINLDIPTGELVALAVLMIVAKSLIEWRMQESAKFAQDESRSAA